MNIEKDELVDILQEQFDKLQVPYTISGLGEIEINENVSAKHIIFRQNKAIYIHNGIVECVSLLEQKSHLG